MSRVVLSFDAWKDGGVAPATVEVPVVIPEVKQSKVPPKPISNTAGRSP
jgi:hypothetical protein